MRVLGISGSLRRDSHNTALLRHAGELFEAEGAEFAIYDGLRELPIYDEDLDVENPHMAVARIRAAVRGADVVFFATPEYNSSIPGGLKNGVDWLSRPSLAEERPAKQAGRGRRGEHGWIWSRLGTGRAPQGARCNRRPSGRGRGRHRARDGPLR